MQGSRFYREHLAGVRNPPEEAGEVWAWLSTLPLTTRRHLELRGDEFRCCPAGAVREIVCTSGTTGGPIRIWLTEGDLDRLAETEARTFHAAGLAAGDVVQLCVTMDSLFMAGLAYYLGLRRAGCAVIRQGPANPARQMEILIANGVTAIVTVPSFLRAMVREWRAAGLSPSSCPLRKAVLVGENLRDESLAPNSLARSILELWDLELYGNYGNTEMVGSMAECAHGCGAHLHPDFVLAEILDERGRRVPPGTAGSLVVTTLNVEGTPLIRYDTGDITFLDERPCACGRTSPRLGPILGRAGQMLKVKGTKLYPSAIVDRLSGLDALAAFAVVASHDEHGLDRVEVRCAPRPGSDLRAADVAEHLYARLRLHLDVQFAGRDEIQALVQPEGYRKRRLFVDRRPVATPPHEEPENS